MTSIRTSRPHIPTQQPRLDELRRRDDALPPSISARELLDRDRFERVQRPPLFPTPPSRPPVAPPPSAPPSNEAPTPPTTPPPSAPPPSAPTDPIVPPIVDLPDVPVFVPPPSWDRPIVPDDDSGPKPPFSSSPDLPSGPLPEAGDTARALVESGTVSRALADAGVTSPEEAQRVLDFGAKVLGKSEQQVANLLRRASTNPGQKGLLAGLVNGAKEATKGNRSGGVADVADGIRQSWDALSEKERTELTKGIIAQTKDDPRFEKVAPHFDKLVDTCADARLGVLDVIAGAIRRDSATVKRGLESMEEAVRLQSRDPANPRSSGGRSHFEAAREAMLGALPFSQRREVVEEMASAVEVRRYQHGPPTETRDLTEMVKRQLIPSLEELTRLDTRPGFHDFDHTSLADAFAARFGFEIGWGG